MSKFAKIYNARFATLVLVSARLSQKDFNETSMRLNEKLSLTSLTRIPLPII